ncbi:mms19 nucleotide excision repair, partial [Desmophyllum pertusum]
IQGNELLESRSKDVFDKIAAILRTVTSNLDSDETSPWEQTQLVSLLNSHLMLWQNESSAESGAQCLAGIINKLPEGDELTSLVNDLMSRIWQVSDKEGSLKRATITWLWLTKAVVIRSHALAPQFIEKVLSLLVDKKVGRVAADGFYIIMADYEEVYEC